MIEILTKVDGEWFEASKMLAPDIVDRVVDKVLMMDKGTPQYDLMYKIVDSLGVDTYRSYIADEKVIYFIYE